MLTAVRERRPWKDQWKQQVVVLVFDERKREVGGKTSHNPVRDMIGCNCLDDDVRSSAKAPLPEVKANDRVAVDSVVLRGLGNAAERRINAEGRKQIRRC